jgi:hypothetical protein
VLGAEPQVIIRATFYYLQFSPVSENPPDNIINPPVDTKEKVDNSQLIIDNKLASDTGQNEFGLSI